MPKAALSNRCRIGYGTGLLGPLAQKRVHVNRAERQRVAELKDQKDYISGLSREERELLMDTAHSGGGPDENEWEDMAGGEAPAPGEESMYLSHAGGYDEVFSQIVEQVAPRKKRSDCRTRADRVLVRTRAWQQQIGRLTDAYLTWKHEGAPQSDVDSPWSILAVDFFHSSRTNFAHAPSVCYANETLALHGFLGCSPENVSTAIAFRVLEAYRQLHRACPRLTAQSFVRAMCHLHGNPCPTHLVEQFRIAFDVYLEIQHAVDSRAREALGQDAAKQRSQSLCPPCMYKVDGEPPLKYSLLCCMDGNSSLKLVDSMFRAGNPRLDDRTARSDMWLSPDQVDAFKDEVSKVGSDAGGLGTTQQRVPGALPAAPADDDEFGWLKPTCPDEDTGQGVTVCVERWKSASPEARKKMFALFAVSGIFVVVCRHGHVLTACDMIRSGELMKYPLACLDKLFELYGSDIAIGYDIACAFMKTVSRSSLGPRATELQACGVVPAFHGHAHNRSCQVRWHPMYIDGVGMEDFEECERTFSLSNNLATATRLATPFHRHQEIEEHFKFHDDDKHAQSGNFIYQNYRQALVRIREDGERLAALSQQLGTGTADYEAYLESERKHLQSLKSEPPEIVHTVDYMECLTRLQAALDRSDAAKAEFQRLDHGIANLGWTQKKITQVRTMYRTTYNRWMAILEEACLMEEEMGIQTRWTSDSAEYQSALLMLRERKYRRALDNLERLVIQRLFELTKLGISGIGYKLREKIGKALKTRAEAIKNALNEYNICASQLNPPRLKLTWIKVIETVALAEFDVLRDTRQDIRLLKWAQPAHREAMNLHFRVKRAHEEHSRLNVEICRLVTYMLHDHSDHQTAIQKTLVTNPALAHELTVRSEYREKVNSKIAQRLLQTSELPGFTGTLLPGIRMGRSASPGDDVLPQWATQMLGFARAAGCTDDTEQDEAEGADEDCRDAESADETGLVVQFMDDLGLQ